MIVYFSGASGYTHRFVEKLGLPAARVPLMTKESDSLLVDEKFVLITPTYRSPSQGYLPRQVAKFLNVPSNRDNLVGVIGSGNTSFGEDYSYAADIIQEKTGVPILYRFEIMGTPEDVTTVKDGLIKFWDQK